MDDIPDICEYIKELDYIEVSKLGKVLRVPPPVPSPADLIKSWLLRDSTPKTWLLLVDGLEAIEKLEIANKIKLRPGSSLLRGGEEGVRGQISG